MGKLDQSLDEIVSTQRSTARRGARGGRRSSGPGKAAVAAVVAPVGGIKKNTRSGRPANKANVPTGPAAGTGNSKIIVSNLPSDVKEDQVKEYFSKTVGPVKKALLTYGPNGVSRGVATIIFSRPSAADKALKELNGLLVDGRAIKVEVVLDASRAPAPGPAKTLSERVAQPKPQPKPANATKASANGANSKTARGKGRGRNPRRKPKSREELDAEMDDYMDTGSGAAPAAGGAEATGAAQPVATNGTVDTGMEDEIS